MKKLSLVPVFFVSAAALGFEIALTRYFDIVSWSEYVYWVISITMVGFAISGVILSLFKDFFKNNARKILSVIPLLLLLFISAGYVIITIIPFNPLELQNSATWLDQVFNVWKYYAALFPFFFLSGLYVGIYFLSEEVKISKVYAADLLGGGAGTLLALVAMFFINPFLLVNFLIILLALAAALEPPPFGLGRGAFIPALVLFAILCGGFVANFNQADFNQYKEIYPALNIEGNKVAQEIFSPGGYFMVLDNFNERLNVDFSNDAGLLKASPPPPALGVYLDGNRVAALPKAGSYDSSYIPAALETFPYYIRPHSFVLDIGTQGGFNILEAENLGAGSLTALEPDPTIYSLVKTNSLVKQALAAPDFKLLSVPPLAFPDSGRKFDIIDVSGNFLGQSAVNEYAFTETAVKKYLGMLTSDGILSIPDSISESTAYTLKILNTVYQALLDTGVKSPEKNILVYRSSWNDRILVSPSAFAPADVQKLKNFADARSFDVSYYAGISRNANVWNELPAVSFESGPAASPAGGTSDALRDDILKLFSASRGDFVKNNFFRIRPATLNQPSFYSVFRLSKLKAILNNIALVPEKEMGLLVNGAVLLQSAIIGIIILLLPLLRWRKRLPEMKNLAKTVLYFGGLGLGFFFFEMYFIGKASFFLNDSMYGFASTLALMLAFSGLGSWLSGKYSISRRLGLWPIFLSIAGWGILAGLFLDPALLALMGLPAAAKLLILLAIIAPLSVLLGFPFPMGLSRFRGEYEHLLPWAWSVNGAFSVVASPLAGIMIASLGYFGVIIAAVLAYLLVMFSFPLFNSHD